MIASPSRGRASAVPPGLLPTLLACVLALPLLAACGSDAADDEGPTTGGGGVPGEMPGDGTGGNTGTVDPDPTVPPLGELGPLPSPPLTPPPSADDEPVLEDPRFHVSSTFPVLADPATTRAPAIRVIDEAAFAAGPPEPVVEVPPGLDVSDNAPPFLAGFEDVVVTAGELLTLRIVPVDPDGGEADQFLATFVFGSRYFDNPDGSKTFEWRPYEADVGIRELTVFALDAEDPAYRVAYTIRIKVEPPADPSTIGNAPPFIGGIGPYTSRVGDPVVVEVTVTDPNGTDPTLEVANLPPDATLATRPDRPEARFLRFVPDEVGTITLALLARDAVDPTLTFEREAVIDVRPAVDFVREGPRLRALAAARGLEIGYASSPRFYTRPDGVIYAETAAAEFDLVTPENTMKWEYVNPYPGDYRWADPDILVDWAKVNDLRVHGHTLVWYVQLPPWLLESLPADREGHMREHIDRMLARYADDVPVWDVVNEALEDDGSYRESIWFEAMGKDYIDIAFRQARRSAPDATLLYNEYDIGFAGPKADAMFALIDELQARGTPLDGIGFQMHLFDDYDTFDEFAANMAEVAARDLDIYITELDVSITDADDEDRTEAERAAEEATQAAIYERVLSACLEQPRCRAVQSWGFTDRHSWRRRYQPLPLDAAYQPKPAYEALQRRLGEN